MCRLMKMEEELLRTAPLWKIRLAIMGKMLVVLGLGAWFSYYVYPFVGILVVLGLAMVLPATIEFGKIRCQGCCSGGSCCSSDESKPQMKRTPQVGSAQVAPKAPKAKKKAKASKRKKK